MLFRIQNWHKNELAQKKQHLLRGVLSEVSKSNYNLELDLE